MRELVRNALRRVRSPILREFSWLSGSNQLSGLFSLATVLVLARTEPVDTVGRVFFAQAVAGVVMLFLDVRFEDAIQRYFPIELAAGGDPVGFFWRVVKLDAVFGAFVAALVGAVWLLDLIPSSQTSVPGFVAIALLSSAVATSVGSLNAGFAVAGRLESLARLTIGLSFSNAVLMVIGAIVGGGRGFLLGSLFGTIVQVAGLFLAVRVRMRPSTKNGPVPRPLPAGLGKFLLKSSLASSVAIGSENGVLTLAGVFGSPSLVAFLRVAQAPYRLVMSVFSPIAVQAFPLLTRLSVRGDGDGIRTLTIRTTTVVLQIGLIVCLLVLPLMGFALETFFGPQYRSAVLAASLLTVAAVLRSAVAWSKVLPLAIGRPGLRLMMVSGESVLILGATALVAVGVSSSEDAAAAIGGANLIVALSLLVFWTSMVRTQNLVRSGVDV